MARAISGRSARSEAVSHPVAFGFTYLTAGTIFGVVLVKSEAVSWFRMQEMFRFQSIHMYGLFATAILTGVIGVALIKRFGLRSLHGDPIAFAPKERSSKRYVFGGLTFGLGWGLTGICPGPMAALIGGGYSVVLVVLASAIAGTWAYGMLRSKLPH